MTIVALTLGLPAGNLIAAGAGLDASPVAEDAAKAKEAIGEAGTDSGFVAFLTNDLLPTSFLQPFADGGRGASSTRSVLRNPSLVDDVAAGAMSGEHVDGYGVDGGYRGKRFERRPDGAAVLTR